MQSRSLSTIACLLLLAACSTQTPPTDTPPAENGAGSQPSVKAVEVEVAENVLASINTRNTQALASFVHPSKGVRFSPYLYVDVDQHAVFHPDDFAGALEDQQKRTWGEWDGVGGPIELTFEEYLQRFVWDHDFTQAPEIVWGEPQAHGNSLNNMQEVYPDATFVEYHFTGFDPQYEGMDWSSLYLVLEEMDGKWKLVGIVHDQWTI